MSLEDDRRIPVEELIEFPTEFSFRAVGHHTQRFSTDAVQAARTALGDQRRIQYRTRMSRRAAYVSVTLTTRVENVDELHAVYEQLRRTEGIITVL